MSETRSVETTAQDIESAIEIGLEQLGVSRESVIVEILEEPSRGLLGLGARHARIRLTTAAPARQEAAPAPEAPAPEPVVETAPELAEAPEITEADAAEETPAPEQRGRRGRSGGGRKSATHRDDAGIENMTPAAEEDLDDDAIVGRATLSELLEKMDIEADVVVYRAEPEQGEEAPWILQIRGDDLGLLIGRRGETLSALQYITRLIASRDVQRRANIVLDVEGYKSRREKMLRHLADRMAKQAIETGRTVSLEPMTPYERRIVHLHLRDNNSVTTQSVGEGDNRKVTILPIKNV